MSKADFPDDRHLNQDALETELEDIAEGMRALGDPTRLKIVCLLQNNDEICVSGLQDALGCTRSALWHHLRVLREAGLIDCRREWKHVIYSLLPGEPEAFLSRFRRLRNFTGADANTE